MAEASTAEDCGRGDAAVTAAVAPVAVADEATPDTSATATKQLRVTTPPLRTAAEVAADAAAAVHPMESWGATLSPLAAPLAHSLLEQRVSSSNVAGGLRYPWLSTVHRADHFPEPRAAGATLKGKRSDGSGYGQQHHIVAREPPEQADPGSYPSRGVAGNDIIEPATFSARRPTASASSSSASGSGITRRADNRASAVAYYSLRPTRSDVRLGVAAAAMAPGPVLRSGVAVLLPDDHDGPSGWVKGSRPAMAYTCLPLDMVQLELQDHTRANKQRKHMQQQQQGAKNAQPGRAAADAVEAEEAEEEEHQDPLVMPIATQTPGQHTMKQRQRQANRARRSDDTAATSGKRNSGPRATPLRERRRVSIASMSLPPLPFKHDGGPSLDDDDDDDHDDDAGGGDVADTGATSSTGDDDIHSMPMGSDNNSGTSHDGLKANRHRSRPRTTTPPSTYEPSLDFGYRALVTPLEADPLQAAKRLAEAQTAAQEVYGAGHSTEADAAVLKQHVGMYTPWVGQRLFKPAGPEADPKRVPAPVRGHADRRLGVADGHGSDEDSSGDDPHGSSGAVLPPGLALTAAGKERAIDLMVQQAKARVAAAAVLSAAASPQSSVSSSAPSPSQQSLHDPRGDVIEAVLQGLRPRQLAASAQEAARSLEASASASTVNAVRSSYSAVWLADRMVRPESEADELSTATSWISKASAITASSGSSTRHTTVPRALRAASVPALHSYKSYANIANGLLQSIGSSSAESIGAAAARSAMTPDKTRLQSSASCLMELPVRTEHTIIVLSQPSTAAAVMTGNLSELQAKQRATSEMLASRRAVPTSVLYSTTWQPLSRPGAGATSGPHPMLSAPVYRTMRLDPRDAAVRC